MVIPLPLYKKGNSEKSFLFYVELLYAKGVSK